MTQKKSIRISYYAIANNPRLAAGQFKYYITAVWGDEIRFTDDGWFMLYANGKCVLSDYVSYLHGRKAIVADYEYEFVKDIR